MKQILQSTLIAAAVAGLMSATAIAEEKGKAKGKAKAAKKADKKAADAGNSVRCFGINDCKGKSECSVDASHACAGKNDCKGKGWIKVATDKCTGEGAKVLEGEPTHKM